jgi:hypothetical protein
LKLKIAGVYILAISPPPGMGEKKMHFLEFGEENRPHEKKNFRIKKIKIFVENLFSITTLVLKSNTFSFNFIIREAQFSFGKDSAQTTKA